MLKVTMFNRFIRKPKETKLSTRASEDEIPASAGPVVMPAEARTVCSRCGLGHYGKDCPLKQELEERTSPFSNGPDVRRALRDVSNAERPLLFKKKVELCSVVYDFSDPLKTPKEKEAKRQTLLELADYISTAGTAKINDDTLMSMFEMISKNIFRSMPVSVHVTSPADGVHEPEEEEPHFDPAWNHLQHVYEILVRYIVHQETDPRTAKKHVDQAFVLRLLELFDSEDPRERDYLKTILHRIYGKFMVLRPFIRKAINNTFYRFIFETDRHNGIAEMLEILGSIISGFALPLKEEHKIFLVKVLIPLHKPKSMPMYQQQLMYCVIQFIEKDPKLADAVIKGILKFWPLTNSHKEVILLGEVEEVLEITREAEFQRCMVPLFRQISRSLSSPHFQVAERALMLWNSNHIVNLITQNRHVILPLIFSALENNFVGHWNQAVHRSTENVRKIFQDLDAQFFNECLKAYHDQKLKEKAIEEQRDAIWKRLEAVATANTSSPGLIMVM
ncbi:hypothetical protein KP509_04G033500 [Ceratopteris richardii]|uniref:Serine/threonine protein phosphatase 2A regulatory subunit n=1 Tax=Ceratopteris richardii TaxID=49495 RepID=A0A8T2V3Q9_CERRI|nr:hypothetical protein KP509_04G033500 [Ceratopteris richardii]